MLQVKKLTEHATIPTRGSELSAGLDLASAYEYTIPARGKGLVKTDLSIRLPEGTYGRIAPRSGLSWKHHTDIGAGVIDRDYRGNVGVVIFNHADKELVVHKGDRVAQLILEQCILADVVECEELSESVRGVAGFGSTGV
jgi:dUTP pyrophosphatase